MKSFQEFQVVMSKLPGLGGGGGGTDSITAKSSAKSFKKRVGDVAKVLTRPFHKKRVDPTEKFATEEVMAAPTNSVGGGQIAGTVEAGDEPPVNKKKRRGEPKYMARGLLPGARTRFKTGADFLTNLKKNKYT